MPTKYTNAKGTLNIPLIQQPIAFIEDDQYPQTGNRLADEKIRFDSVIRGSRVISFRD